MAVADDDRHGRAGSEGTGHPGSERARPDGGAAGRGHRSPAWATCQVGASYLAVAITLYWSVWSTSPGTHMQLGGDQFATVWFLRWIPFALTHAHNPFFTTFGNYPFGVDLLTNTSVPLLGLVGAPVTLLFGPTASYNLWCTVALAGSATAGYLFARRWTSWRPAAWVCGLLYGFSPYEVAQSHGGHLNLTFVVFPPLILLATHEVVVRRQRAPLTAGVVLGLLVVAQFFVSSEVLASTLVVDAVCVIAVLVMGRRSIWEHLRPTLVGAAWAAGVSAALLAYPVWLALRGPGHINGPIQLVPQAYRADLLGPVVPDAFVWLAPTGMVRIADGFANSTAENGSYLGITLLVTLAVGTVLLWRRSAVARTAAIGGMAAFVLSLGGGLVIRHRPGAVVSGLPLPERLLARLPLLSNTIPVRYSLYVTLFAGLLLALVLDRLHSTVAARSASAGRSPGASALLAGSVPLALALVCLLPLAPDLPLPGVADPNTPAYFASPSLAATPAGEVSILYPYPSSAAPEGELWQADGGMHFKSPGGYFLVPDGPGHAIGFSPIVSYGADTLTATVLVQLHAGTPPPETSQLRTALLAQFRSWNVRSLVASFGSEPRPADALQFLTWLVGRPPVRDVDVDVWILLPG
ncbi:MAG TPA: hypothetical protein VFC03_15455 [Acidimicrobiales bacterium]|nr:hypothetical protein [Acidimicrobiales bacterium]